MEIQQATDTNFKELLGSNSKVIVKYYADWCGSCKLFSPKFRRIANDENNKDVLFLDVNAEENPEARKMANVDNLPFFATFSNGQLLEASATSKEDVVNAMIQKLKES
jgi:thiol-disulfide isomerase/thioredoxin